MELVFPLEDEFIIWYLLFLNFDAMLVNILNVYQLYIILNPQSLENQFFYPIPKGRKLIFFAPLGAGVNEENQFYYV
jgi:hypothetical protein